MEAPGGRGGPGEGPTGGEGEARAPEGLVGKVCMSDMLVLKSSWRKWSTGLRGRAAGGPGQELQLMGSSVFLWGL